MTTQQRAAKIVALIRAQQAALDKLYNNIGLTKAQKPAIWDIADAAALILANAQNIADNN